MTEQLQDIRIKLTIETNKVTFTRDFELGDFGDIADMLDEFIAQVNDRLGEDFIIQ